jgi:ABC-type antimicrobial peptide transport system permease subunit
VGGGAVAVRGGAAAGGATTGAAFGGGTSSSSGLSIQPAFPLTTIALALIIAVVVSVLAALYPAWRASKMEPIDALREL